MVVISVLIALVSIEFEAIVDIGIDVMLIGVMLAVVVVVVLSALLELDAAFRA